MCDVNKLKVLRNICKFKKLTFIEKLYAKLLKEQHKYMER